MINSALNIATPTSKPRLASRPWFIILLLITFAPVGLWLMWRYSSWSAKSKTTVSTILGLSMGLITIGAINSPPTIALTAPHQYNATIKTDESKYVVSGVVSSVHAAALTINNSSVPIENTKFEHKVQLSEGENKVQITATNKNGSDSVEFSVHRTASSESVENKQAEQAKKQAEQAKELEKKRLTEEAEKAAQAEAQKVAEAAAAEAEADRQAAEEAARLQAQQQPPSNSPANNYSPNSGVTSTVSGYCNDGTYVTGNPSARGKANACYGHRGWRDY